MKQTKQAAGATVPQVVNERERAAELVAKAAVPANKFRDLLTRIGRDGRKFAKDIKTLRDHVDSELVFDIEQYASALAIAREMWRLRPDLVEARIVPAPYRRVIFAVTDRTFYNGPYSDRVDIFSPDYEGKVTAKIAESIKLSTVEAEKKAAAGRGALAEVAARGKR
jgi:hypothetical protein